MNKQQDRIDIYNIVCIGSLEQQNNKRHRGKEIREKIICLITR